MSLEAVLECLTRPADRWDHLPDTAGMIRALPRVLSVDEAGARLEVAGAKFIVLRAAGEYWNWQVVRDTLAEAIAALLEEVSHDE